MKKIAFIFPIIFFLLLAINAKAQIQIQPINGTCPDICTNSTLYTKGILDTKLKICTYTYHEDCRYGCRIDDTKIFETPSCNELPKNDTSTALEKIYDELKIMKQQVYQNSPSITVHGTEYTIGECGKIWVQVLDANKLPVDNATCYVDIYRPANGSGHLFEKALMSFIEEGIYYYNFLVPNEVGVYPSIVNCYYVTTTVQNNATSGIVDIGTTTSGDYISTWILDSVYWVVREILTNVTRQIQIRMNFTNVTQPALQTGLGISWAGIWNSAPSGDSITIHIKNFTSGNWIELPNKITDTGGSVVTVTNTILTTNATASGLVNNGIVSILFNDTNITDASLNLFKSDYVHVDVIAQFSSQYQQIIGSGEIHVSSSKDLPYTMTTLCGETTEVTSVTLESACAVFTNTGEFNMPEGELEDNITIIALETKDGQYWKYRTPPSVSCDALYWLKEYNGTGWTDIDLETLLTFTEADSSCNIFVPIDLVRGNTYEYRIKMDNYVKWEIDWSYVQIINIKNLIVPYCDSIANISNYTYVSPITNSTIVSNDPYLSTCHHLYDDFYWSELYYNSSLAINTAGENLQNWDELRFYRESTIKTTLLLGENGITNTILSMPSQIWSHPNRTLTDYNQSGIFTYLWDMNYTQNLHYNSLYSLISATNLSLSNKIDEINATIFAVNQSIWGKLFTIQGELQDINNNLTLIYNLIGMVNTTIMNKLFMIQDEITSLNNSIINGLMNVSNLTINITTSQDEVIGMLVAFGGDKIASKGYAYMGFLPFGGLGEENALWSCKDNVTLVKYTTKYIRGSLNKTYIETDEQICTYGCVKNACVLPAYQIWIYVFIGLIAVFILYLYFSRSAETGEISIF
jgi:hypothetical protein